MKVRLMGPRGMMEFVEHVDLARLSCAAPHCGWHMDYSGLDRREVQEAAVWHVCGRRWLGFARYTIAPERPAGRRTA